MPADGHHSRNLNRRAWRRPLGALAGVLAVTGTFTIPAGAAEPAAYQPVTVHTSHFAAQQRFGERSEVAGDVDKDGVNDVYVASPSFDRGGSNNYGRVWLADGKVLGDPRGNRNKATYHAEIGPPEQQPGAQFGFWIENIGDVNGDGYAELVVGADGQDVPIEPGQNSQICDSQPERCRIDQGKAWAFDGKTRNVLYELNNPRPQGSALHQARFGSRIGTAGDVNGDGTNDVIVGASGNDNPEMSGCSDDGVAEPGCRRGEGQAFIFDGRTGALIRELNLPPEDRNPPLQCQSRCGSLGLAVQSPGDVDGDGVADQLVTAGSYTFGPNASQGRMYVYSGATGAVIRRIDNPAPQANAVFGFQDVSHRDPGDVNGDGRADIYANGFTQAGKTGTFDAGRAWVFNGGLGTVAATPVLYELSGHPSEAQYGAQCCWSMTRDRNRVNPGSTPDDEDPVSNPLVVGASPHHAPGAAQQGQVNLFNAATGVHQRHLPLPPPWAAETGGSFANLGPNLGWTVSSPGDLNGDGFRDFVAGAPFTDVCEVMLGSSTKRLNVNQGVIITFRSNASGTTTPDNFDPANRNPADNVCEPAGNSGL